jgi:lipopolysaccharide transport system permease protein
MTVQEQAVLPEREPPASVTNQQDVPQIVIKPLQGWIALDLREVWQYRELLYFFVWRDIKVRYKQTILGAAWAIIVPFMDMIVFSLFFGYLAGMPSDGVAYPVWNFTAQVPWRLFASGMTQGAQSLVTSAEMIKKIYFPRIVMPTASTLASLVDFMIAFAVLLLMLLFFGYWPTLKIVWIPIYVFLTLITALGAGLWLSAMNVQFRDVRYTLPFLERMLYFLTPIVYPSSLITEKLPESLQFLIYLYYINPMVSVVDGFRWALLGTDTNPGPLILISTTSALLLLISGAFYFRRMEKTFADVA